MSTRTPIDEFRESIRHFLSRHGLGSDAELSLLRGGANNRVFCIQSAGGRAVLKQYFRNPNDSRDRFRAEHSFYNFIAANRIEGAPTPLGWETELRVGLFRFIEGRKLAPDEVDQAAVRRAGEFIVWLNQHRHTDTATGILPASEACFSIAQHLECVQRRVTRLDAMRSDEEVDRAARAFAHGELKPAWDRIRNRIVQQAGAAGLPLDLELPATLRCLSPSDFGFHNALLESTGLRFFDFEYAGWDDPAKLICDFFCQPELPADRGYWNEFTHQLATGFATDPHLKRRADLLYPAYQIKWCCIILNDFLGSEASRRKFAMTGIDMLERKKSQLEKARKLVASIS